MTKWSWRDLSCAPWFLWSVGITVGWAKAAPPALDWGWMPALLIAVAAFPALLLVWLCRARWIVRRGWWIPLALMAIGAALVEPDAL